MKKVALIWDTPLLFSRLLEECGCQCEQVTPHLLAAPFFRGSFSLILIPGGFGDRKRSRVLPALKALSGRFKRYVASGGVLFLFGAVCEDENAYQWLVPEIRYHSSFCDVEIVPASLQSTAPPLLPINYVQNDKTANVYCIDGYLSYETSEQEPDLSTVQILATAEIAEHVYMPNFLQINYGKGVIFICTIHEYPTTEFLKQIIHDRENVMF